MADPVATTGDDMTALFAGPEARSWSDLEQYTGRAAAEGVVGEDRRRAYLLNYQQLGINYGENVEFQLRREQVILCPQTVDFLYSEFTPLQVRYERGTRPVLEEVVREVTADCATETEKALALMRFSRDLYGRGNWDQRGSGEYIYGGTEEELIEKGEQLCECLGRLHVALCEVAGIPGRIVMHNIGGHICSEVYVDGGWAYMDPRFGLYFRKPGGGLASVRELQENPRILRNQEEDVKADVSERTTWEERVRRCESMYFDPREVNGFQNYSLADAGRYNYGQLTHQQVEQAGLFDINREYRAAIDRVFSSGAEDPTSRWAEQPLRRIPLAHRHDGYSTFFRQPPLTRETLLREYVDLFDGTHVETVVWGLGPGSVFCFDTKVGEVVGASLTAEQWEMVRTGDRWVHENVMGLIEAGHDPVRVAAERAAELGLKLYARLEMNHEYGPADPDNWLWVTLVGNFNKDNPQFRIPGRVLLDFKHEEVRAFKLAVLREAAEAGSHGLELDFAVYPPFFEKPDCDLMTEFVAACRAMLDEVGAAQGRSVDLTVRVPFTGYMEAGLDWPTWMRRGLVDMVVMTHLRPAQQFEVPIDEAVALGRETGVKVYGCIWHSLGFVSTDQMPQDEQTRTRRYDKPKTREMFHAQALLFHRAGADGIQLAMAGGRELLSRPWYNDLADPDILLLADKHYMVDPSPSLPLVFTLPQNPPPATTRVVSLRIADDVPGLLQQGHGVEAELVFYCRGLQPGELLEVFVNGHGPVTVSGDDPEEQERSAPVDLRRSAPGWTADASQSFISEADWWKRGEHRLALDPAWLQLGRNELRFEYGAPGADVDPPLRMSWVDLLLRFGEGTP